MYLNLTIGVPRFEHSEKASENVRAQVLARKCAEPRPAGDSVKAAIGRAAGRASLSYSRMKDIWYGDERARIEPQEMEQLRAGADAAELACAMGGLEVIRRRLEAAPSRLSRKTVASLDDALRILGGRSRPAPQRAR